MLRRSKRKSSVVTQDKENQTPNKRTKTIGSLKIESPIETPTQNSKRKTRRSILFQQEGQSPAQDIEKPKSDTTAKKSDKERANEFELAKKRLHVSAVPESLPCREDEFSEVLAYIQGALEEKQGTCIYISGVPGTGKTATVREVIRYLEKQEQFQNEFQYVEINGMKLTEPSYAYSLLWKEISGKKMSSAYAKDALDQYFNAKQKNKKPVIVVMDELDLMVNRKQSLIYNFFNWPTKPRSNLIVVAIANTMDLPEQTLSNKISSRLGLTRINFMPYTFQQLEKIIESRINGLGVFEQSAVQFCARKVSAVSGDARRALDIFRRAAELAEKQKKETIKISIVEEAIQEMFSSPSVQFIQHASIHQKLFMASMILIFRQTGIQESEFGKVAQRHIELCKVHNLEPPNYSALASICSFLGACRALLVQNGRADIFQKIRMNVTEEDFLMATRQDDLIRKLL